MEHFEPDQITVALVGEKLVGYIQVEPQGEALYIRMLLLAAEYRRQGIGALILELVLSAASEQHLGVKLQVFKINESAKRFYERHGFRVVGETSTSLEMKFDP
jgi:ribosomal protein S18 acetylase RimI-like enzyme